MAVYRWLFKKVKGIDKERMNKTLEVIQKESGKSKLYIRFDMIRNFLIRGCGYTDYFRGNYIQLTKKEKDTFVTAKKFYRLLDYLNDEKYEIVLKDKLIFNRYFKEFLKRDYIDLRICTEEEWEHFLKGKKVVFAKSRFGEGGHGISKIQITDDVSPQKLWKDLKAQKQFLVEEEILQCKEINEMNPHVVCSFRVVTLYKDGEVTILNNALRVNQDETNVIGCTNDLYFSLNEDGKIDSHVVDDFGNIYESHPLTKKNFKEVQIPYVKEAFAMCKKAAHLLPEVRYIGWDVAFTDKGPLIVEGNEYPGYGLFQFYKLKNQRTGHLKEVSDVLKDEMKNIRL